MSVVVLQVRVIDGLTRDDHEQQQQTTTQTTTKLARRA